MTQEYISQIAHEAEAARWERANKRLWIVILVLIILLAGSNGAWIWYESQFEDVVTTTQTVTQDTGSGNGNNTFTGDFIGGDYYGEANSNTNED